MADTLKTDLDCIRSSLCQDHKAAKIKRSTPAFFQVRLRHISNSNVLRTLSILKKIDTIMLTKYLQYPEHSVYTVLIKGWGVLKYFTRKN